MNTEKYQKNKSNYKPSKVNKNSTQIQTHKNGDNEYKNYQKTKSKTTSQTEPAKNTISTFIDIPKRRLNSNKQSTSAKVLADVVALASTRTLAEAGRGRGRLFEKARDRHTLRPAAENPNAIEVTRSRE